MKGVAKLTGSISAADFAAVRNALDRGYIDSACAVAHRLVAAYPRDPNAWLLKGLAFHKRRDLSTAKECIEYVCRLVPNSVQGNFWLGVVERQAGNRVAATVAFEHARLLDPRSADIAYNLGLLRRDENAISEAGYFFSEASRLGQENPYAMQHVVNCAKRLAISCAEPPTPLAPSLPRNVPRTSFVVCSIARSKLDNLRRSIDDVFASGTWDIVHIPDARSLNEGYARGARQASGDILVFCHDDILLVDPDFQARLVDACADADVVGVCGTTRVTGASIGWSGRPYIHGWITHQDEKGRLLPSITSIAPPRVERAEAMDGVFVATRPDVVRQLGFDETTFDGFHLYDMDFTYRAHMSGWRLRIQSDLLLVHASKGRFDEQYRKYASLFLSKHRSVPRKPQSPNAYFFEAALPEGSDPSALRRFYGWIRYWIGNVHRAEAEPRLRSPDKMSPPISSHSSE